MHLNIKKIAKLTVLVGGLGLLSSCAMVQKLTCNEGSAKSTGARDAEAGKVDQPGLASANSCEGAEFGVDRYKAEYKRGFEEKRAEMCQMDRVSKLGTDDGMTSASQEATLNKLKTCQGQSNYKALLNAYQSRYQQSQCSTERANQLALRDGQALATKNGTEPFNSCGGRLAELQRIYDVAYTSAYQTALKQKEQEFVKTTGTSTVTVNQENLSASCRVSADQSSVQVSVSNPTKQRVVLQGPWNYKYFDKQFAEITSDSSEESVLLNPGSAKTFMKMTLPRNASFCRAEFAGSTGAPVFVR